MTPAEFAQRLGVKRTRVYKWIERGHLSVFALGPPTKPNYLINANAQEEVKGLIAQKERE